MGNQYLPTRYVEIIQRLAMGIEPMDAASSRRLGFALQVRPDRPAAGGPRIEAHTSGNYAIRYPIAPNPNAPGHLRIRVFDADAPTSRTARDRRRIVPRRLEIPLLALAEIKTREQAGDTALMERIRRPAFFPGAAWPLPPGVTALRGRVVRGGQPMRWARVIARLGTKTVGHAHGDDRGEFLLLIRFQPDPDLDEIIPNPLANVRVTVFGPAAAPVPATPDLPLLDPLWDLPVEKLITPEMIAGTGLPTPATASLNDTGTIDYTSSVSQDIDFPLGRCLDDKPDFVLT
ncbi:MAG: hypothetical protein ACKV2V_25620 [Blastocatellia bacterium]